MDTTPRKRTKIVTLSQHTSMTVRDIAAAAGVGKSSVSRIINQQKNFGTVSPKRKSKCGLKRKTTPRTKITLLDWPGNSPDVNPIENLWSVAKRHVSKVDCSTKKTMIEDAIIVWFRDGKIKTLCSNLVESMPNRVQDLIQAGRGHILYKIAIPCI
ncbi:uncharacterized protein TNCV_1350511 [Trichonephila clavipes]|nr:uncharacterized protein TNCV_1350511 [Trichonephila clavipes]